MPAKKKEQELITQEVNPMMVPDKTAFTEVGQLLNVALEKSSDIETLERVMKLYEQGQAILAKQQFNHAFAAFQKELPTVKKSKTACFTTTRGGTMSYSYASMDDVVQAVQPVLHKFGLSYWFEQSQEQIQAQKDVELQPGITETRPVTVTVIKITCHLGHVSGHSISNTVSGPMDSSGKKNPIQQMSSTVTYLRRIAMVGILGVACTDEDVDGHSPDIPEPTAQKPAAQKPAHYTDNDFQRNLPKWRDLIQTRKSNADEIITLMNSKAPATPQQVKQIKAIKPEVQNGTARYKTGVV